MKIKTVGQLRELISNLSDDYTIEVRVRKERDMQTIIESGYSYPFKTYYTELEFDDIGVSDKVLCIGTEVPEKF